MKVKAELKKVAEETTQQARSFMEMLHNGMNLGRPRTT